ncbi:MAG: DUF354 domain-containing protein [Bacteroidetes bacterium]|nr:DUF354 domain-containing protein [Bacteroidota bacterium]
MKILIDIGHPAHVHLFRNFAKDMLEKGNSVLFTTRDKEMAIYLLKVYNFEYHSFGKPYKGIISKIIGLFLFNYRLFKVARKFKADIFLSHGSIYAAQVSSLLGKKHISFEDTGNMEQIHLYKPFTKVILVSNSFKKTFSRQIVYNGYHELAYLHPNQFKPNRDILKTYGLDQDEKLILLRFVSWNATHDLNHKGLTLVRKIEIAQTFTKYGRVLISSENELPEELLPFKIKIKPEDIFHVMAHCSLVFGESGTMASEAAVLGVSAIYIDSTSRDYTQEQEKKYGLVFNFAEDDEEIGKAIKKSISILENNTNQFKLGREKLLKEKIDVSAFLSWFIDNYPQSVQIMKENPSYQYKFI